MYGCTHRGYANVKELLVMHVNRLSFMTGGRAVGQVVGVSEERVLMYARLYIY